MNHQIKRQTLEVIQRGPAASEALSERVQTRFELEVLPQLEALFDRLVPGEELLMLDKLEVDIGSLHEKDIQLGFAEQCIKAVEEALRKSISQEKQQGIDAIIKQIPKEQALQAFAFFLQNGFSPWWWDSPAREVWEAQILQLDTKRLHTELAPLVRRQSQRSRLLLQFSQGFVQQLILAFQPEWKSKLDTIFSIYQKKKISQQNSLEEMLRKALAFPLGSSPEAMEEALAVSKEDSIDESVTQELPPEGQHVAYAGLVILWPFLQPFFDHNELLSGKAFTNEETQIKAIHLLGHLAGMEDEFPEENLLIAKLLCGYPVDKSFALETQLSERERTSCQDLLQSVIRRWPALKTTPASGLQNGFLQRPGLLLPRESGWSLRIETHAIDILLNKLPWSIGYVSLPWMEGRLVVEWG